MRIIAEIVFSGDAPECDPELAAEVLRVAGYQVHKMPPLLHSELEFVHPLDDCLEAVTNGPPGSGYVGGDSSGEMTPEADKISGEIMDEINALVDRYGGMQRLRADRRRLHTVRRSAGGERETV
jgi:hypothetical protein